MECTARITPDLLWVGGNDRRLNLFENIFPIPRGVSYNSYLLLDEKPCSWTRWTRPSLACSSTT